MNPDSFIHVEDISIDYTLFEKTDNAAVMPCSIAWSDIGSWMSVADSSQDVKKIFEKLKNKIIVLHLLIKKFIDHVVHIQYWKRPIFYKIKRLEIKSNQAMSLQSHQNRSEHWVVVDGVATIIHLNKKFELFANQSTFIPANDKHRIANNTENNLVVIEVQCGSYLGEDDIERFDYEYDCY